MGKIYNEFGVEVYTMEDMVKNITREIYSKNKEIKEIGQKIDKKDFKLSSKLDYLRGYVAALEKVKLDMNRKDWKVNKEIKYKDTPKGKLFKYLDDHIIPELDKKDVGVVAEIKEQINNFYEHG